MHFALLENSVFAADLDGDGDKVRGPTGKCFFKIA